MKINLVTQHTNKNNLLFYFTSISKLIEKALKNKIIDLNILDVYNKTKYPDDKSFSGLGMCLKYESILKTIEPLEKQPIFNLSPDGIRLNDQLLEELLTVPEFILISSRYEGIDERIINNLVTCNISVGDFVLSNGDIAASLLIDCLLRKKGMVKKENLEQESFRKNRLDFPVYTRPNLIEKEVPDILLKGNHKLINEWREKYSLLKTIILRPDIIKNISFKEKKHILELIKKLQEYI